MLVKRLKKIRISLLFFTVIIMINNGFTQSFFKENKKVYSNFLLFSDSLQSTDTIVFINNMDSGRFPSLRQDTVTYLNKKSYYTWSIYDSGASISYSFKVKGRWQGKNRYYNYEITQNKIFGKDVLIFLYEEKLYFFEIIENRPAPYNNGSLIALIKL